MQSKWWFFSVFLVLFWLPLECKPLEIDVRAESAILINADTGAVLFEKDPHRKLYPASITKIATAIYALNVRGNKLEKVIAAEFDSVASISEAELKRSNYTLPAYWLIPGASHIGIKNGEELSLKDLLYGNMIASGGDASNVIAQYIGGTIPMFIKLMNEFLQEIGCRDTVFKNPHGLHHPDHVTTAYDMALLTSFAMKNQAFREIVKTVRYPRPQTNKQQPTTLIQTNRLLKKGKYYYPKAIGVKTGYTSLAQNTLVAAAENNDRTLIAVLMRCKDRDDILKDAINLFEEAFNEKKVKKKVLTAGPQATLELANSRKSLAACLKGDVLLEFYPSEAPKVSCAVKWDTLELPIKRDQHVGVLEMFSQRGDLIRAEPLYALAEVKLSPWDHVRDFFTGKTWIKVLAVFVAFLFLGVLFLLLRR